METIENENLTTNIPEPNIEKINNIIIDEITIHYLIDSCQFVVHIIITILFPLFFYIFMIHDPYRQIIRVNKKKKLLIMGTKGMADCCSCCVKSCVQCDLNGIKNVKLKLKEVNASNVYFRVDNADKIYLIDCDIYSLRGQSLKFCFNVKIEKEKYDEIVLFFKQFTEVIEEKEQYPNIASTYKSILKEKVPSENAPSENAPSENVPSENEITTKGEQNNIESKPSFNEGAPMPVMA